MKIAAVFGAGGAKGAYEMGVVRGLQRQIDEYVCAFGCSAGSLISTCIATKKYDFGERAFTKLKTGNFFKPIIWDDLERVVGNLTSPDFPLEVMLPYAALKGEGACYNIEPFEKLLDDEIDFNETMDSDTEIGFLTTNFDTMRNHFFSSKKPRIKAETLRGALLASINIPLYIAPVKIPGKKGTFVDGGLARHLPGKEVLNAKRYQEADVILFVTPVPKKMRQYPKRKNDLFGSIVKTLDGVSDWNFINSLNAEVSIVKEQAKKDNKKFVLIQPDEPLPITDSFKFIPKETKEAYKIGLKLAAKITL